MLVSQVILAVGTVLEALMTVKRARMMAMVQMIVLQDQEGMLLALLS